MSQSNMFVYSSDMVHQPVEELIMSDDEMEYSHESDEFLMQNLHMVNPSHLIQEIQLPIRPPNPFDISNEEFLSINLGNARASVTEENYRRQIERMTGAYLDEYQREPYGRNTWLDSPTSVCEMEEMEPPVTSNLDIYGFSEDEMDNMDAQFRRWQYDDREARLHYYSSSDEGIPESAFDDTSSVGSFYYDSDEDSVLLEREIDEWEEKIKWTVEDKTDPDDVPELPLKNIKTNKETKNKYNREQKKQAARLTVKEQTDGELTKREKKTIEKFHKSSNIQSSKFSKIKKSKEISRQRTAKYSQLTQSTSTNKEELYDMFLHDKENKEKIQEKTAAELENAKKRKHEKRQEVFFLDEWRSLREFKAYERFFISHMDIHSVKMSQQDLYFKSPRYWTYRVAPNHLHNFTYIPRKIRRPGQELLTKAFWLLPNYDYFIHKPKK